MHLLQQSPLYLSELREAVVNPMGCISAPMGFVLQTPAFGVVSNVRRKEQACVLVSRRRSYIKNVVSSTQMESNMVVSEDTEFKSSFDEYLKAMESIRVDREKKQVQKGSGQGKKPNDVAFSKEMPRDQKRGGTAKLSIRVDREKKQVQRGSGHGKKLTDVFSKDFLEHRKGSETVKFKNFKRSDGDEWSEWSERVADKKLLGGSVQARNSVQSKNELSYVRSENVSSKKPNVDTTTSTSSMIVKKKNMPMNETSDDNDLEMERFIFQSSELLNDGLDVPRVTRMEMEERIQSLARCLNDADEDMPQWLFAKTMRSARIRFSDHSIMRVIQILGKFGNWWRVLQVIEWLQMHERFKSHKISCT